MTRVAAGLLAVGTAVAWGAVHAAAPAVRGWARPHRIDRGDTTLRTTVGGRANEPVVLLLHGITASGLSFGRAYDALDAKVVVPDLLGFGGSMNVATDSYSRTAHVDAVTTTLAELGLADRPTLVVGHSMGAVLALHVADALAHPLGVVAVSAPMYDDEAEGLDRIGGADPLAGLLAVGDLAERVCAWMCAHRSTAKVLWPLLAPQWPHPIAADGVLHTWPSYRGSLDALVLDSGYADALAALSTRGVPVTLVNGSDDGVPVAGRAADLAAKWDTVEVVSVDGASHALPVSHGEFCAELIAARLAAWAVDPVVS